MIGYKLDVSIVGLNVVGLRVDNNIVQIAEISEVLINFYL